MTSKDSGSGTPSTRLYVGGYGFKNGELDDLFRKYGELCDVSCKGQDFSFVEFTDLRDAEEAARAVNNTDYNGHRLRVEFAHGTQKKNISNCFICGRPGHWARDCPDASERDKNRCFNCNEVGHMARECPNHRTGDLASPGSASRDLRRDERDADRDRERERYPPRSYRRDEPRAPPSRDDYYRRSPPPLDYGYSYPRRDREYRDSRDYPSRDYREYSRDRDRYPPRSYRREEALRPPPRDDYYRRDDYRPPPPADYGYGAYSRRGRSRSPPPRRSPPRYPPRR